MRRLAAWLLGLGVVGAAAFWFATEPRALPAAALDALPAGDAARGELWFWAGGCASCHAAPKAEGEERLKLGGGLVLKTDFGDFVAPNISTAPRGRDRGLDRRRFRQRHAARGLAGRAALLPRLPLRLVRADAARGRRRPLGLHGHPAGGGGAGARPRARLPLQPAPRARALEARLPHRRPRRRPRRRRPGGRARPVPGGGARPLRRVPHPAQPRRRHRLLALARRRSGGGGGRPRPEHHPRRRSRRLVGRRHRLLSGDRLHPRLRFGRRRHGRRAGEPRDAARHRARGHRRLPQGGAAAGDGGGRCGRRPNEPAMPPSALRVSAFTFRTRRFY